MEIRSKFMCLIIPALMLSATTVLANELDLARNAANRIGADAVATAINLATVGSPSAGATSTGASEGYRINNTVGGMDNNILDPSGYAGSAININLPEYTPPAPYCVVPPVTPPVTIGHETTPGAVRQGGDKTIVTDNGNGCVILPHYLDENAPKESAFGGVKDIVIERPGEVEPPPIVDDGNGCVILPHYLDENAPVESAFGGVKDIVVERPGEVQPPPPPPGDNDNGCVILPHYWDNTAPVETPFGGFKDFVGDNVTVDPPVDPPVDPSVNDPNYNGIEQDKALKNLVGDDANITENPVDTQYAYDDDEIPLNRKIRKNIDGTVTVLKRLR